MKIVINRCFGGFNLSEEGEEEWLNRRGFTLQPEEFWTSLDIPRNDPTLVQLVEEDAWRYGGPLSYLRVVAVPDGVEWVIEEHDGMEVVAERHRTWY